MPMAKRGLAFVGAVMLASIAADASAACVSTNCKGKIKKLSISELGIYVQMDSSMTPLNCTLKSGAWITLTPDHAEKDAVYALLLSGHISQSDGMTVRIKDETDGCHIQYVTSE
jgi:hypothetical protein